MAVMAAQSRMATASESDVPCLTADECDDMREKMGITGGFYNNDEYTTKGCYFKNNKAFFSLGTEEEMTTTDLPGILTRIWCDNELQRVDDQGMIEVKESNDVPLEGTDAFIPVDSFLPTDDSNSDAARSSKLITAISYVGLAASLMGYFLCE
jgi:hypothetical protein